MAQWGAHIPVCPRPWVLSLVLQGGKKNLNLTLQVFGVIPFLAAPASLEPSGDCCYLKRRHVELGFHFPEGAAQGSHLDAGSGAALLLLGLGVNQTPAP